MRIHQVAGAAALASMLLNSSLAHEVGEGKGALGVRQLLPRQLRAVFQHAVAMLQAFWCSARRPCGRMDKASRDLDRTIPTVGCLER